MSRYRASLIHLLLSVTLLSVVFAVVFFSWYPKPAFEVVGASSIIRLLIAVDLVMGPLLTLVVFKHGKPGLKFDLAVIALMQIGALAYGAHRLYDERPQYMVFAVDRVEFVSIKRIDTSEIQFDELRTGPLTKLIKVFARRPQDPEDFQRYLDSIMVDGKPDLEARPEYWEPWLAGADEIREQLRLIGDIQPRDPGDEEKIAAAIDKYGSEHASLGVLPIGAIDEDIGLLVDQDSLEVVGILRVNPWPESEQPAE